MQHLIEGVHYFQNVGFKQQKELFERLAEGQTPRFASSPVPIPVSTPT